MEQIENLVTKLNHTKETLRRLGEEKAKITDQIGTITAELMIPSSLVTQTAWERIQDGDVAQIHEIDSKSSLRETLELLEGRERFLNEAIEGGMSQLDVVRGKASLAACRKERAKFVQLVRRTMLALKELCDANQAQEEFRRHLEEQGFSTGALAYACFDIGNWGDVHGRVGAYVNFIRDNYPEIKSVF